jgi:hypothetical protein
MSIFFHYDQFALFIISKRFFGTKQIKRSKTFGHWGNWIFRKKILGKVGEGIFKNTKK